MSNYSAVACPACQYHVGHSDFCTAYSETRTMKISTDTYTLPYCPICHKYAFEGHTNTCPVVTRTENKMTLPADSQKRKDYPLFEGCLKYFPAALAGIAGISKIGNDKHNPGQPLHHARDKSSDHGDCIIRHLIDVNDLLASKEQNKEAILTEVSQMAWRALALSQEIHEKFGAPLAPGAKLNE
jgi:hypothetical protein